MKVLNNRQGLTLVEIILAIVILGMSATMLALTFSSAMRILNRATTFKNVSTSAAETIEVAEKQETVGSQTFAVTVSETNKTLTVTYTKDGVQGTTSMGGQYYLANSEKESESVALTYKEFLPSNFSYDIPATPVGG